MKSFDFRSVVAVAAMVLLAACGGSATPDQGDFTSTAAVMVHGSAPVADCEAEGCNQPRIVDGLAEQYRFSAVQQREQGKEQEQPAEPAPAAEPLALAVEVAAASEEPAVAGLAPQ